MSDDFFKALRALSDRIAIQDVICGVTLHSDLDEPEAALALYEPRASIDYSAVSGPESQDIPVEEHRRRLATFLPGFDKRQHQVTNFEVRIDGDAAVTRAQVRAIHTLGSEIWLVYGTYHHRLARRDAGWKITYQRADLIHQEGQHLVEIAKQRVLDHSGGSSTAVSS